MAGWLRRLMACGLIMLLSTSQILVPSFAAAQPFNPVQGEIQFRVLLEGGAVEGEIDPSDIRLEGVYAEAYVFNGYADDKVTLTVGPTQMTGVLMVVDMSGGILGQIEFTPNSSVRSLRIDIPADGNYGAMMFSVTTGAFSLQLSSEGDSGNVNPLAGYGILDIASLQLGQWREGTLGEGDSTMPGDDSLFYDMYAVTGTPGQRYRVTVEADGFDPAVVALDRGDQERAKDLGRNGRVVVRGQFDEVGLLVVGVATLDKRFGDYRIIVEPDESR